MRNMFLVFVSLFVMQSTFADCFDQMQSRICVVNRPGHGETMRTRPCQPEDTTPYYAALRGAFDQMPVNYKRALCSLQNIYIETDGNYFGYTGYTWFHDVSDVRNLKGAYMRFGKAKMLNLVNGGLPLSQWYREDITYQFRTPIDQATLAVNTNTNSFVYFMAHELTHVLDLYNRLNTIADDTCARTIIQPEGFKSNQCEFAAGSYSDFSWIDTTNKKGDPADLSYLNKIYCYNCPAMTFRDFSPFMRALYERSSFISPYGTLDPWEDMAEVAGIVIAAEAVNGASFTIDATLDTGAAQYNLLTNGLLQAKRDYVRRLMRSPTIGVPGFAQ